MKVGGLGMGKAARHIAVPVISMETCWSVIVIFYLSV
jgi:hypothetical protein